MKSREREVEELCHKMRDSKEMTKEEWQSFYKTEIHLLNMVRNSTKRKLERIGKRMFTSDTTFDDVIKDLKELEVRIDDNNKIDVSELKYILTGSGKSFPTNEEAEKIMKGDKL